MSLFIYAFLNSLNNSKVSFIIWYQSAKLNSKTNPNPSRCHPSCSADHMLLGSMVDESSSTTAFVSPYRPIVLNRTDLSRNLIVLDVNVQGPLKLIATNHSAWWLQFMSLLFMYDLLGFVDDSTPCLPIRTIFSGLDKINCFSMQLLGLSLPP